MTTTNSDGAAKLRSEILDEARRQAEEILRQARAAVDQLIGKAEQEAQAATETSLTVAQAEAKRRRDAILSTVSMEVNRLHLGQTEALLDSIRDKARDQLRRLGAAERREAISLVAVQAVTKMDGNGFLLRLSPSDLLSLGDGLPEEIRRRWARPWLKLEVIEDPEARDGNWVLNDGAGRQRWDLGLEARLDRLWPQLRRQIAEQAKLMTIEATGTGNT